MRVIAGSKRRILLKTIEGDNTRPTTDRIKETLFNMIGPDLYDTSFLDLFAGSGQIGIEALSRGAAHATFVENNKAAAACIKENLTKTHSLDESTLIQNDVLSALAMLKNQSFEFVFMDPPYSLGIEEAVLNSLFKNELINEDSTIIIEAALDRDFCFVEDIGYRILKEKIYKTNKHVFVALK